MYRITILLSCLCLFLSGCGHTEKNAVLRVAHTLDDSHVVHQSLVYMRQRLSHYSNGQMSMKIYANGQLGSEREMVELLQIGSLAMTKVSAAALEGFIPEMQVFSIPYIFKNREHRWQVLQSEIGEELLASMKTAHLTGLGYFDAGSRSFYTCGDMVYSPKDIAGKKIRVMNSQTAIKMIDAFGGAATPISWGELYAALQQGVVDGAENNPPSYFSSRHYEICKQYSLNEHSSIPDVIIASQYIFDSLTRQQQGWLKRAMDDAVEYQKSKWLKAEEAALKAVKAKGVEVIYPDKTPFFKAVESLHQVYDGSLIGNYLQRIKQQSNSPMGES